VITWTTSGAVQTPDALQLRVGATYDDRLAVGAPTPSRALTLSEVADNVRHFTTHRQGPRARAVHALVLSGVYEGYAELAELVRSVRAPPGASARAADRFVRHVVVHAEASRAPQILASPLGGVVDDLVSVIHAGNHGACPPGTTASVRLDHETLAALPQVVRRVQQAGRVVFTWPFPVPGAAPPPPNDTVVQALVGVVDGVPSPSLKGLPPCGWGSPIPEGLAPLVDEVRRTRNRFYVDAEHQLDQALVFFPDLVQWTKSDRCRCCRIDARCDGVVGAWYDRGLAGAMEPLDAETEKGAG